MYVSCIAVVKLWCERSISKNKTENTIHSIYKNSGKNVLFEWNILNSFVFTISMIHCTVLIDIHSCGQILSIFEKYECFFWKKFLNKIVKELGSLTLETVYLICPFLIHGMIIKKETSVPHKSIIEYLWINYRDRLYPMLGNPSLKSTL